MASQYIVLHTNSPLLALMSDDSRELQKSQKLDHKGMQPKFADDYERKMALYVIPVIPVSKASSDSPPDDTEMPRMHLLQRPLAAQGPEPS